MRCLVFRRYPSSTGVFAGILDGGIQMRSAATLAIFRMALSTGCAALAMQTAPADAKWKSFEIAGATETAPMSINDSGAITGLWTDSNYQGHGFVRDGSGSTETFDISG